VEINSTWNFTDKNECPHEIEGNVQFVHLRNLSKPTLLLLMMWDEYELFIILGIIADKKLEAHNIIVKWTAERSENYYLRQQNLILITSHILPYVHLM
jgi:hypothetical protein